MAAQDVAASWGEWVWSKCLSYDHWMTMHFAGEEWTTSGRTDEYLPWKELPLSNAISPTIGVLVYLISIPLITRFMRDRKAVNMPRLVLAHNLFLCIFSGLLMVSMIIDVAKLYNLYGFWTIYSDPEWLLPNHSHTVWNYVFYVSKYYELLDTLLLLLKKRKPTAVQIWHHASVLFLFWGAMNSRAANQYWFAINNTFCHVFVYGYFAMSTVKVKVPWKHLITTIQVTQFWIDLVIAIPWPYFKTVHWTHGDWGICWYFLFVGITFIVLFTQILVRVRREAREARRARRAKEALEGDEGKPAATNGHSHSNGLRRRH